MSVSYPECSANLTSCIRINTGVFERADKNYTYIDKFKKPVIIYIFVALGRGPVRLHI